MVPFNKPHLTGKETHYIYDAVNSGKISGNGLYTKQCHEFFCSRLGVNKVLLTTSCTDALEMAALLIDLQPGDEVIMPAYTFVSTANAFVLRGAKIVFVDSEENTPNMDVRKLEELITNKTKVIVPVHYAGVACDMDEIIRIAKKYNLFVVEDAAQAIDSYYKGKPLGCFGHFATFSFHETKNIISGEGGMLVVNDDNFSDRAEIIWEKGTNRAAFFRGEVDKYGWVDVGSSFLPSEIVSAFLYAQIENLDDIQRKRKSIWAKYSSNLEELKKIGVGLPEIPGYATNNAHMFYLVCRSNIERKKLLEYLREEGIHAVFHYLGLHQSPFYAKNHDGRELKNCEKYHHQLVRLPFFYELTDENIAKITGAVLKFYNTLM